MAVAVIIFGTPGAGKSSIARQLARLRPDTQIFDTDLIAGEILTLTGDIDVAFDVTSRIFIRNFLFNQSSAGVSVFTDSLSTMSRVDIFRGLSRQERALFFRVLCPVDVALQRISERQSEQLVRDTRDSLERKTHIIDRIDFEFEALNNGRGGDIHKNALTIDRAIEHLLMKDRHRDTEVVQCR